MIEWDGLNEVKAFKRMLRSTGVAKSAAPKRGLRAVIARDEDIRLGYRASGGVMGVLPLWQQYAPMQ